MEIFIKLASRHYEQLRSGVPSGTSAAEAVERATRIDHSLDGVLFEGYSIPCDERAAHSLLEIARQCCPDAVAKIHEAIQLAAQTGKG
jgi:hypothetical protein